MSLTRAREPTSLPLVVEYTHRMLLIIARPARLLECLEFDPSEFYQMLEVAEDQVKKRAGQPPTCLRLSGNDSASPPPQTSVATKQKSYFRIIESDGAGPGLFAASGVVVTDVPKYIISKLGLSKAGLESR
ncbi:unnamed protein product [Protopolystoma xenopodis]|uniref:Microtubule-associated serine/threonine-protein kinase pre-PK domain-containing protein n=1 Tax=Protopolystoma xenopodis TaxID=117903 RepID=A0A3S5AS28_9PLAT|nr:unnamed protein product [Protopolystoma xenopodis]